MTVTPQAEHYQTLFIRQHRMISSNTYDNSPPSPQHRNRENPTDTAKDTQQHQPNNHPPPYLQRISDLRPYHLPMFLPHRPSTLLFPLLPVGSHVFTAGHLRRRTRIAVRLGGLPGRRQCLFHPAEERSVGMGVLFDSVRAVAMVDQGKREEEGYHSEWG